MEADFVIIGSGSAGSAMAYRLGEDGKNSVLVLEYGGTDYGPFIQMPAALSYPMNMARYDWGFHTEPEPNLGGRVLATPRGKVPLINAAFTPTAEAVGHARDVVAAFEASPGAGVLTLDGKMIDQPHLKRALRILARAS